MAARAGRSPATLPAHPDHRTAHWRTLSSRRRLAVLADNTTPAQARLLLPAGPGCAGIATAPHPLADLVADGATRLRLGALTEHAAEHLLHALLGTNHPAPEHLQRAAARACRGLPLAACLAAAHLTRHPSTTPDQLTRSLTQETPVDDRLTDLDTHLPAEQSRAARLLALHPGPRIGPTAADALLPGDHTHLLHGLVEADLLTDHGHHTYTVHDAVHTWLHTRATRDLTDHDRAAARARLLAAYRDMATTADLALNPWRWRLDTDPAADIRTRQEHRGPVFADAPAAMAWLDAEQANIRAVIRLAHHTGHHTACWQTVEPLKHYLTARRSFSFWQEATHLGLESAQACGAAEATAFMRMLRGELDNARHEFLDARAHYRAALTAWQNLDHAHGIASCRAGLGVTYLALEDDLDAAVDLLQQSVAEHKALGSTRGAALHTRHLAGAYRKQRHLPEAIGLLDEAIGVLAEAGDHYQLGRAQRYLAEVHLDAGHPDQAEAAARDALASAARADTAYETAGTHVLLADIAHHRGHPGSERTHLAEALDIFEPIGAPETARIRRRLDELAAG
ncbi:hypothetical protein [Streptomonospora sediminis]